MGERVLVCGGRDYAYYDNVVWVLDCLHNAEGIDLIIQGGALGADRFARQWANKCGVMWLEFKPDWNIGKSAGPIRNQRMLDEGKPDLVVAFPGGRGTADMVRRAKSGNFAVLEIEE